MLGRFKSSGTKASILQILLAAYFITTAPAMIIAVLTVNTIEKEVVLHTKYFQSGDISEELTEPQVLLKLGSFLRRNSMPFTHSDSEQVWRNSDKSLKAWTENLRDIEAAIIYSWGALLLVGLATLSFLVISMHRTFQSLYVAVEQLNQDKINEQIEVYGPADVRNLSAGLENLRIKIQDEERLQQQLLRHISHEIKTPLTSIKEGSKLLDEQIIGTMNSEQLEIAKILVKSSDELQNAIENLLNYNVAVASLDKKQRSRVNLKKLVERALEKHELAIRTKELRIQSDLNDSSSEVDPEQILTVFDNLISNAIKHSPESGMIHIWLQNKKGNKVGFIIKDQGPGVSPHQEKTIFEPFFVGNHSKKLPLRGTGLGLSIAKHYVDEHNGEVTVLRSKNGAAFQVTLPCIPPISLAGV